MPLMQEIKKNILANGRVDGSDLEALRQHLYANGKPDRPKADFLVELHKRVQHMSPAFEQLFYQAVKDHLLADGQMNAEKTAWLRQMLFADGKIDDQERKLLHEMRGEAKVVSREFESLFRECMKQPVEQHTCG